MTSSKSGELDVGYKWSGDWWEVHVFTDDILLRIHDVLSKSSAPGSRRDSGSHSLVAAVSDRNWTQNPIVKGKNFLFFYPYYWLSVFLLFLAKRIPRKSLSIDHENVLITHLSVEMKYDHIAQCEWVHKLQEFNLLVIQTPTIKLV